MKYIKFHFSLVDDRVVVRPGDGTPQGPPTKFRGIFICDVIFEK